MGFSDTLPDFTNGETWHLRIRSECRLRVGAARAVPCQKRRPKTKQRSVRSLRGQAEAVRAQWVRTASTTALVSGVYQQAFSQSVCSV